MVQRCLFLWHEDKKGVCGVFYSWENGSESTMPLISFYRKKGPFSDFMLILPCRRVSCNRLA